MTLIDYSYLVLPVGQQAHSSGQHSIWHDTDRKQERNRSPGHVLALQRQRTIGRQNTMESSKYFLHPNVIVRCELMCIHRRKFNKIPRILKESRKTSLLVNPVYLMGFGTYPYPDSIGVHQMMSQADQNAHMDTDSEEGEDTDMRDNTDAESSHALSEADQRCVCDPHRDTRRLTDALNTWDPPLIDQVSSAWAKQKLKHAQQATQSVNRH